MSTKIKLNKKLEKAACKIFCGIGCLLAIVIFNVEPAKCDQQCNELKPLVSPNLGRVSGIWYKMASTSPFDDDVDAKCNIGYANWDAKNLTLEVTTFNYNKTGDKKTPDWAGNIYIGPSGEVTNTLTNTGNKTVPYFRFFETDYVLYQVPYGCPAVNGKPLSQPIIWIQSRTCNFNKAAFNRATKKLAKAGVKDIKWKKYGGPECCVPGQSSMISAPSTST